MNISDPIADMLARLRNAHGAFHKKAVVPGSKMKASIAEILKAEGYIADWAKQDKDLKITLKYSKGKPLIAGLKRVSKPGRRIYVGVTEIPRVQNGLGICILSTPQGLLTGEDARAKNVGGELLCEIW